MFGNFNIGMFTGGQRNTMACILAQGSIPSITKSHGVWTYHRPLLFFFFFLNAHLQKQQQHGKRQQTSRKSSSSLSLSLSLSRLSSSSLFLLLSSSFALAICRLLSSLIAWKVFQGFTIEKQSTQLMLRICLQDPDLLQTEKIPKQIQNSKKDSLTRNKN